MTTTKKQPINLDMPVYKWPLQSQTRLRELMDRAYAQCVAKVRQEYESGGAV